MGWFGASQCTKSSRKPECSPIWMPGGRSDRCQRHRGRHDEPMAEADTFGLGTQAGGTEPADPASESTNRQGSPFCYFGGGAARVALVEGLR